MPTFPSCPEQRCHCLACRGVPDTDPAFVTSSHNILTIRAPTGDHDSLPPRHDQWTQKLGICCTPKTDPSIESTGQQPAIITGKRPRPEAWPLRCSRLNRWNSPPSSRQSETTARRPCEFVSARRAQHRPVWPCSTWLGNSCRSRPAAISAEVGRIDDASYSICARRGGIAMEGSGSRRQGGGGGEPR